jgi:putative oxidoreductase
MNLLQRIANWGDSHHPKWLDIVRIALGLFLCYKGILFLQNSGELIGFMENKSPFGDFNLILISHFVVFAHIIGGILIATGFYTRYACMLQIPILIAALFFLASGNDVARPYSDWIITIVVLLLLIYFLIAGNGVWSVRLPEEKKGHQ